MSAQQPPSTGEAVFEIVAFGLFFTCEIGFIVTIMMIILGRQPKSRAPRPKGPTVRVSLRGVAESLRQFRNLSRKD